MIVALKLLYFPFYSLQRRPQPPCHSGVPRFADPQPVQSGNHQEPKLEGPDPLHLPIPVQCPPDSTPIEGHAGEAHPH